MLEKRNLLFLLVLGVVGNFVYAENWGESDWSEVKLNYEAKLGITPYERYGSKTYSERYDDGLDFGLEVYRPFEKYSIGFGGEVKRQLNSEFIKGDGERLYAYYLLAKREIGKNYSLVARLGRTSQREFDSTYYIAAGLEKRFGRVTVQILGENTKLKNDVYDKNYTTVGLKIGYIFGDISEPNAEMPMEPLPETVAVDPVPAPMPKPEFKLVIEGDELTGGYEAYVTSVPVMQKPNVHEMINQLNEYDKPGVLEMTAYSDNTGSKELNVRLANERMDNLEKEFVNNGLTEKVRVEKVDPEGTVKSDYKVDNGSFENRKLNRRIEVTFFEDEESEVDANE